MAESVTRFDYFSREFYYKMVVQGIMIRRNVLERYIS